MKTLIKYLIISLIIISFSSCVGYQPSTGIGRGMYGGPCGTGITPIF
ncbi:MAG: hypothetical protein M3R36_14840 [Bacteroidota bacterium]|nr:hypothetical protein [Bacteroidota bacterium]